MLPSHQLSKSIYIVGHKKTMLPGGTFNILSIKSMFRKQGIELLNINALTTFCPHKSGGRIKQRLVAFRALHKQIIIFQLAQFFGNLGNAPVVVCIFQGNGYTPSMFILGQVSIFDIVLRTSLLLKRTFSHRLICLRYIKSRNIFQNSIGNYRDGMVTRHGIGFPGTDIPNRQQTIIRIKL